MISRNGLLWARPVTALLSGALLLGLLACGEPETQSAGEPPPVQLGEDAPAPQDQPQVPNQPPAPGQPQVPNVQATVAPDTVIARVDGVPITQREVDREIDMLLRQVTRGRAPISSLAGFRPRFYDQAMQRVALKIQMEQYAEEQGLAVTPEEIGEEIDKVAQHFDSTEAFKEAMAASGVDEQNLRSDARDSVLMRKAVEHFKAGLPQPSSEELRLYYEANIDRYTQPEQVTASHILVAASAGATPGEREALMSKAEAIRADIVGAASFDEAAGEYWSQPDIHGSSLGTIQRNSELPQPFVDALFELGDGEVSEVVQTQFGYHVIGAGVHSATQVHSLEDAREQVVEDFHEPAINDWMESLLGEADIQRVGDQGAP